MTQQPFYLIFKLEHCKYGIPASVVQELFFLPEITPVVEAPLSVLGVINLRGEIIPIVNLHHQLGQNFPPLQLTDSIVILQSEHQRLGIVINQVLEVEKITATQIQTAAIYGKKQEYLSIGIVTIAEDLVTLLNPNPILQSLLNPSEISLVETDLSHAESNLKTNSSLNSNSESHPNSNSHGDADVNFSLNFNERSNGEIDSQFNQNSDNAKTQPQPAHQLPAEVVDRKTLLTNLYSHLSLEEQQILKTRSENLRVSIVDSQDSTGQIALAVIGLESEYFGFGLEVIHEFTDIDKITPIPCCPPHIIGNINLRGEIVTLVDISHIINLSSSTQKTREKAIVVRHDEIVAGIIVDDIFDVLYLDAKQISNAPVAMHSAHDEYLQGVAPYRDKMMSIINLPKILTTDTLVVNEEV
jgi:purine-binding chemotaxis protein CheW